ncbi:heme/hemin ABC transporter substrate-binding protein [Actinoplanes derwentensis]|uniref:Iron complex transport system substrate-binding protein n=1 Tax=Actinoplanes derwentensis TaxID=113562 RepID=A0A1H2CXJ5_9ACTN|nr:ABC transporter substrate-binding protein [Actinoplanes derwentensis]GID87891.1 ABC transporter substrate-binding protein [Actinoplanes derwentensis]SDT74932.1 iron complex transport system substrate-binding protein [Actinoplanes derwentensis]
MIRRTTVLALAAFLLLTSGCTTVSEVGPEDGTALAANCGATTAKLTEEDVDPLDPKPVPRLPVTVKSADGRDVTVKSADRILAVNLYGSLAEIVFSLGLGDRVIGRDTSTAFPAAAKLPLVTPQGHGLSAEAILKLNPTVLIADDSIGPATVLKQIRDSGIPVVIVDDEQTLEAIPAHIRAVAGALGVTEAGERLVTRVQSEIDTARKSAPKDGTPPRIVFLYVRGTAGVYLIGGEGAGSDAMIEAIGAVDAGSAAGLKKFRPLTSEGLINAAPDVILVMTEGLNSVGGVDGLLELPGVAQTPAGVNNRIVDMEDGVLLNFGARTGKAVEALAGAVYATCQ